MQKFPLAHLLLSLIFIFEFSAAKPTPGGSHTHVSITPAPVVPAKILPVAPPASVAYNVPILAYNLPLDAATASQRIDVQHRYDYNYLAPMAPPIRVIASPYVEPRHLIYASSYPMPAPYYAPGYMVPLRYNVPVGLPTGPLFI